MKERLVENWLTKTNELGYQLPFCQLLSLQGHRVVHKTRHGSLEQGKDIIAISPDGKPCAYQLKTGNISLSKFRDEVWPEVEELLNIPIKHPAINKDIPHNSFLVTNGDLSEEVRVNIHDRNEARLKKGEMPLQVIVKGQLLKDFVSVHGDFFPQEPPDVKRMLELYVRNGADCLPKKQFSAFLLSILPFSEDSIKQTEFNRASSSALIIANYLLEPYRQANNHWAIAEGWIVTISHIIALALKNNFEDKTWEDSFETAMIGMHNALKALLEEALGRKYLVERGLFDGLLYKYRLSILIGFMCGYALSRKMQGEPEFGNDTLVKLCKEQTQYLELWGENSLPSFLALYWFLHKTHLKNDANVLLVKLIEVILSANQGDQEGIINPYYEAKDVLRHNLGFSKNSIHESFNGASYGLESLVLLATRQGLRDDLTPIWRKISHIHFRDFIPETQSEIFMWEAKAGKLEDRFPNQTQSWKELQEHSLNKDVSSIPSVFIKHPEYLLLFLMVYPHRLRHVLVKYLDMHFNGKLNGE